jgi:hypothetical protein
MSFSEKIERAPHWMDIVLSILEPAIIVGITLLAIYASCWLMFGNENSAQHIRMIRMVVLLNENWKVGLILLLLLFYRPIRIFLEQLEQGPLGMKRRVPAEQVVVDQQENP